MKAEPRVIVFFSDPHAGSRLALMPEEFTDGEGGVHKPSALQLWIRSAWKDAVFDWLPRTLKGDPCHLVGVGDMIEGVHHGGAQVVTNDVGEHTEMALTLIAEIMDVCKPVKTYMVEGTECHTGRQEAKIGEKIGAVVNKVTGKHVFPHLRLPWCGNLASIAHHIGATSRPYLESGQYSPTMGTERIECARAGWRVPNVFVRAHRHRFGYYCDGQGLLMVTGPWQALTRHGHKVVTGAIPMPSIQILDMRGVPDGELPMVRFRKYAMKEPTE